jgi:hypothetical protein
MENDYIRIAFHGLTLLWKIDSWLVNIVPASPKLLENPSFLLMNSPFFGNVFWVKYVRLPRQHFLVKSPVFFVLRLISLKSPTNHHFPTVNSPFLSVNWSMFLHIFLVFLHVPFIFPTSSPRSRPTPRRHDVSGACVEGHAAAARFKLRARDAGDTVELLLTSVICWLVYKSMNYSDFFEWYIPLFGD